MTLKRESFQYCVFIKSMDLFFCHLLMLAVLVSMLIVFDAPVNAYYIRFNHGNESKLSTDSAVVGRIKREPCEVVLYYDVVCHGRCPPYEEEWNSNREHMNCLDELVYHCAKDNTTGKYVEACADPIRCERGKEPRLVFPEGHTKTAFVTCQYCANEEFYNPSEFKLSSTYYMCPKWKRPCEAKVGQIQCDDNEGIERHWKTHKCRCDVKQGYIQDFSDHQTDSLCEDSSNLRCIPFQCDPTRNGTSQELLKNYTCVPVCDEGFQRNDTSDLCTPIPRKASSTVPNKFTVFENPRAVIKTTQMLNPTINNVTIETTRVSTLDVKETTPTTPTAPPASTNTNVVVAILGTILGVIVIAFILTILYYNKKLMCKQNQNEDAAKETPRPDVVVAEPLLEQNQNEDAAKETPRPDVEDTEPFLDKKTKCKVQNDDTIDKTNSNETSIVAQATETEAKKRVKLPERYSSDKVLLPRALIENADRSSHLNSKEDTNIKEENDIENDVQDISRKVKIENKNQIAHTLTIDTVSKGGNIGEGNIPYAVSKMHVDKDEDETENTNVSCTETVQFSQETEETKIIVNLNLTLNMKK